MTGVQGNYVANAFAKNLLGESTWISIVHVECNTVSHLNHWADLFTSVYYSYSDFEWDAIRA